MDKGLMEKSITNYIKKIKMNADDVTEFSMVANMCPFEVSISCPRCVVDAKKVIELATMDFSKILTIEYNGYDRLFERYLERYEMVS